MVLIPFRDPSLRRRWGDVAGRHSGLVPDVWGMFSVFVKCDDDFFFHRSFFRLRWFPSVPDLFNVFIVIRHNILSNAFSVYIDIRSFLFFFIANLASTF